MKLYDPKKILVPVDFSEWSPGVVRAGVEIGKHRSAEVTVLHVAKESEHAVSFGGELPSSISKSKLLDDFRANVESRLELMVREAGGGPRTKSLFLWGDPVRDILSLAESGDFDLIVMATHGRRGLNRLFMGSVTEEVIRRAPCPVLAIRSKVAQEELARMEVGTATAGL